MKKFILSLLAIFAVAFGAKAASVTDELTVSLFGVSGTSYTSVTGISASSDAEYSAQCAGGNNAIQLRSNNNNSGVVTTKSGGIASEIKVTWNGATNAARVLQVYGSHSAFSSPSDLYNNADITLIGEIDVNSSTLDLDADKEFEYIGFRSKSGAMYLDKVEITWSTSGAATIAKPTLTASQAFVESLTVEITSDYTVYYTTDGNDPKASDAIYADPFEITETTTVKAVAYDGTTGQFSSVAEATYTKMEKMTIAEAQAADAGTEVFIEGDVVAAGDAGCVITDGTDFIYYYAASGNTFTPGMKVRGIGKTSAYGGAKQMPAGSLTKIDESKYEETATPLEVTGALLDQYVADAVTPRCYATVRGTLSISGNYYNISVEGANEAVASIIKPMPEHIDFAAQMDGKEVIVTGYLMYVNKKYVYFVATEMQAVELEALDNASFDENPQYNVDSEGNLGTSGDANCATIPGWELVGSAAWCSSAEFEYGTKATLNSMAVPATGPEGSASTGALGLTVGWSGTIDYTQACFMPAGYYQLTYWAYNANPDATQFKSNVGFEVNGGKVTSTLESFPTGEWIQDKILIKIENEVEAFIHVGGTAVSGGSGSNAKLFIDDVELVEITEDEYNAALLESVKESALADLANYVEGDGLFYWSHVTEAKDAVAAATTEDEIIQALALPTLNKPVAGTAYAVKNTTAKGNLNVAESTVSIKKNAAVYFTEVEGGWAISGKNESVDEYIFKTDANTWTLQTTTELSLAYVITVNPVDGGYTLTGLRGTLGLDNADEGSTVYANKTAENYGVWTIAEWTEPASTYTISVADLAGVTLTTDPEGEAEAGTTVTVTAVPEEGYIIDSIDVTYTDGTPVQVEGGEAENTFTFVMPAEAVVVSATLGYEDPNDYTDLIENPAYLHKSDETGAADYAGWTFDPELPTNKWRNYDDPMNLITYSSDVNFTVSQTIPEVPAGKYRLSVYGFYRAGSVQDEANRVASGEPTHNLAMFAEFGDDIKMQNIMNLYEGAADIDVTGKNNHSVVPGTEDLFIPDGAVDSREFYIAGYYRNDLEINVTEATPVRIGVIHPEGRTYTSDYAPLGGWELYRLGDAEGGEEPKDLATGKYYLCNVATEKWWAPGNNWGTQASLLDHPDYVTLISNDDGTYKMETSVNNGGTQYYFEGEWMDNANPLPLTITRGEILGYMDEEETEPVYAYYISNNGGYFGYNGQNTIIARNLTQDDENAVWIIATEEDLRRGLAEATAVDPVDATFLIIDQRFGRNRRDSSAWTNEGGCVLTGGNSDRHGAEKYHGEYNVYQTLVDAPSGVYKLDGQGFYRQDGSDDENLPVLYANDATSAFPILPTGAGVSDMNSGCTSFEAGNYKIDPVFVEVEDGGSLTIGTKLEGNTNLWVMWDNFSLTYYGPDASLAEVMLGDLIEELAEQRALAEEYAANPDVPADVVSELNTALSDTENVEETPEAYRAAIDELKAANEKAAKVLKIKATLDAMKKLTESTNFYTQEAYEEYYGQWQAKYDAGTLTDEEASGLQNPYKTTGWHDAITVDNLLLSVWDADPDIFSGYYINSWSVEGENDGTNFIVPFFEYWTDSANTLAKKTLTAKIENLPSGEYNVTAWVRVQTTNGAAVAPYGISMKVNDGDAVDVCTGASVDGTQFYIDEFTATGTVGEDGVLTLTFNVDDTNVSWLSFQNVKYEQLPPPTIVVDGADVPVIGTVDVEASVEEKMPYTGDTATFNTDDVLAFFGGETTMSDLTVYWLNPDGATVTPAYGGGTIDGWRNAEGFAAMWGDSANGMCVKLQDPASGIFDYIGAHDGNFLAGDTYVAKYAFVKDGQAVVVALNVNFYAPAPVEAEVVKTIVINHDEIEKIGYSGNTETGDAAAICEALGVESLSDVIYKVAFPAGEGYVYEAVNTDGWRDATTGEQKSWGSAEGLICVKVWDETTSEASADLTYIGCIDDTHVAGETCTFYYAFIANNKAVIYQININFVSDTTGINAIATDALLKGNVFDLSGRKVGTIQKGQIYIVNGKKIMVK